MQQKNLIVFILGSALIVISLFLLRQLIWPPPPPSLRLPDQSLWAGLPGHLWVGVPPGVAPGNEPQLQAAQIRLAEWTAGDRKALNSAWLAAKEKPGEQLPKPAPPVVAQALKPVKPGLPAKPRGERVLSNENIRATITSLGGGIKDLTLTRFQEADRLGRPVKD